MWANRCQLGLLVIGLARGAGLACAQESTAAATAQEIVVRDVLAIDRVGRTGRSPVHTDAVEAQIVAGTWTPPQPGEPLTLPDGSSRTWQALQADPDGTFRQAALRGGYACATIALDCRRELLLDAAGHNMVYVNGQPRAGDPYKAGYVRLPVVLEPGQNHLLFACGRGELRARLIEPKAPLSLDLGDSTLPDLVAGEPADAWAAVVVINCTNRPLTDGTLTARWHSTDETTALPPIPAYGVRKVGFRLTGPAPTEPGVQEIEIALARVARAKSTPLDTARLSLRVRKLDESRKRTFISEIDGSVQYYAVQPMRPAGEAVDRPALFLTLHGASVEALGQADAYRGKSWGQIVAPTNRRPYGFDWEDWGRIDALEVLAIAEATLGTDPRRTYLTGHSMGGHGVWQIGAHHPDRFAAIAPSAGWISFWSYTGADRFPNPGPTEAILTRASNPSDTLALSRNYLHHGVYVLHGENDDNVPVEQARTMRKHLGEYHADFAYYERPGAGHWWGGECVDWPPLFDFLRAHVRPATSDVRRVEFATMNPAISATCAWATIQTQRQSLALSKIDLKVDAEKRLLGGTTENVARLAVSLQTTGPEPDQPKFLLPPDQPITVDLDGQHLDAVPWPSDHVLGLVRSAAGEWTVATGSEDTAERAKRPDCAGPFKEAFRNRVQLVYGTAGSPEENAWALAKARYDAETFWVRGNGSLDVLPDVEFRPDTLPARNVVLYGNAETNRAWPLLFAHSPVQVGRGKVRLGDRVIEGDDLGVLAVYPRPGQEAALVGVVSGTGPAGMRLTDRLPYFISGAAYPDWIVLGPDMLQKGSEGVRAAGFLGPDWNVDPEQSAWREP